MSYYYYYMSCVLTFKRDACSIFFHNFIKGVEREEEDEELSDYSVELTGSNKG